MSTLALYLNTEIFEKTEYQVMNSSSKYEEYVQMANQGFQKKLMLLMGKDKVFAMSYNQDQLANII